MRAAVAMTAVFIAGSVAWLTAHTTVVSPYTYYQDIQPLFERSCASCHDQRGPAPPLLRYADAQAQYAAIARVLVEQGRPEHGSQLTHRDFDRIMTWAAGGTPEGPRPPGAPLPPPKRHAAHAGQLGGMLVPLAGDTMHAEVVWSEQRRLRVYVTSVTGEAHSADQLASLRWSVTTADGSTSTLTIVGDHLEARIPTVPLPGTFTLIVPGAATEQVQFQFGNYSAAPPEFVVPATVIPSSEAGIIEAIREQAAAAQQLVISNGSSELYVPTTHLRDLLLALDNGGDHRDRALRAMIRATWSLHLAGDNGLPREIRDAAAALSAATTALTAAYAR
jgi:mono/diheme cytochrome c family protein